jgi:hypothetical protein
MRGLHRGHPLSLRGPSYIRREKEEVEAKQKTKLLPPLSHSSISNPLPCKPSRGETLRLLPCLLSSLGLEREDDEDEYNSAAGGEKKRGELPKTQGGKEEEPQDWGLLVSKKGTFPFYLHWILDFSSHYAQFFAWG